MMKEVVALILGGGVGTRLYPLTKLRAKPAVPMAGHYRLVDVPISNCINSGLEQIFVLTQFNSVSLHRHITQTYRFDLFSRGWVQILAAEQTLQNKDWYQGTADAVRKQLVELKATGAQDFVILSGDHLYRMDYGLFLQAHRAARADITLAVLPVPPEDAPRFGIVQTDAQNRVTSFYEKPSDPEVLARLATYPDPARPYLGSMGVYIFRAEVLYRLLAAECGSDFGKHILPASLESYQVFAWPFDGYWEDIGTIQAFYRANLALVGANPPFSFYDPERPIYTHPRFLPPSSVDDGCVLDQVLLADGSKIIRSHITQSVVGVRSRIGPSARLTRTVMLGADFVESDAMRATNRAQGLPDVGIGAGSVIEGAIIDKNARIGPDVTIRYQPDRPDLDTPDYAARDGLIIVLKNGVIPAGTII